MQLDKVREQLNKFGKFVIQQARSRLTKGGKKLTKNDTKKLYNSLEYKPFRDGSSIGVYFYMEDYGKFQDQGVKGTKSNYVENKKSPFSYSSKMPNPEIFESYIKRKGIKASMFFTKPFNQAYEKLPAELQESFVKDIEKIIFDNG